MKIFSKQKSLTLGDFVMRVYDNCEARRAAVIVWLAMQTHLIVMQEQGEQVPGNSLKRRDDMMRRL